MGRLPHSTTITASQPYYRITAQSLLTTITVQHRNVVNGQGAVLNPHGSRYAFPNAVTVYLTEAIETCLAEKLYYVHREYLPALDNLSRVYPGKPILTPPFELKIVLWEITFKNDISDVAQVDFTTAGHFQAFPCMLTNPSQDYEHLKKVRAGIQAGGYAGLRAPSSRDTAGRHMVVLFSDQRRNVSTITPHVVDCRLVQPRGAGPFTNHSSQELDYRSAEVEFAGTCPSSWPHNSWQRIQFNHY
jgi:RES domain